MCQSWPHLSRMRMFLVPPPHCPWYNIPWCHIDFQQDTCPIPGTPRPMELFPTFELDTKKCQLTDGTRVCEIVRLSCLRIVFFFHFFMYFSLVLVLVFAFGLKVLTLSVPLVSNCPYFIRLQCKHLFAGMKRHLIFIAPRLVGVLPFYIICFSLKNMKYKFPCDSLWHVPLAQQTKRK